MVKKDLRKRSTVKRRKSLKWPETRELWKHKQSFVCALKANILRYLFLSQYSLFANNASRTWRGQILQEMSLIRVRIERKRLTKRQRSARAMRNRAADRSFLAARVVRKERSIVSCAGTHWPMAYSVTRPPQRCRGWETAGINASAASHHIKNNRVPGSGGVNFTCSVQLNFP